MKKTTLFFAGVIAIAMVSCSQNESLETENLQTLNLQSELTFNFDALSSGELTALAQNSSLTSKDNGEITEIEISSDQLTKINEELRPSGIALFKVESMSEKSPIIIFDKQLELKLDFSSWVEDDPRRAPSGGVTYNVAPFFTLANGSIPTEDITDDAYTRWSTNKNCGSARIIKEANPGVFNSAILSLPGVESNPFSDINVVGHLPSFVFGFIDGLDPEGTLGVAFTFIFVDEEGNPTDIDNDNRGDTSLKEVWYNDGFTWTDNATSSPGIDLASVITHESGHTLEAGHFGTGIFNSKKGTIKYSPRAVMNALYFEPISDLRGTDGASYCRTFGSWK